MREARTAGRSVVARARRGVVYAAAAAFGLQLLAALCGLPGFLAGWLADPGGAWPAGAAPRYVVVLGGGGIPSETGLIRTYYAARAPTNAATRFVVALPADGDPETGSVGRMRGELVLRGIPRERILMEHRGRNTHRQAVFTRRLLGDDALGERVLVVTSPAHARRAVLCFRKAGFTRVAARPAYSIGAEAELGRGLLLRYALWSNMEGQAAVLRELCALLYYKVRGWV